LLAICDGLAYAKVDEIVVADKGVGFTIRLSFAINVLNDAGVQSEIATIASIIGSAVVVAPTVLVVAPAVLVVVSAILVVSAVLVVVTTVLAIVSTILVVVSTVLTITVTTEPVVLTDYETIRLRDEEADGKLSDNKNNKREL